MITEMKKENVPGLSTALFDGGEIKWTECYGVTCVDKADKVNENTVFNACSISKLVTAICVLKLSEKGKIDLDKNVNEYLTSWKLTDDKGVATVGDLLAHQGGIVDADDSFGATDGIVPNVVDLLEGKTSYNPKKIVVEYTNLRVILFIPT